MADQELLHRIHGLSDLELAVLLGLMGKEHCIIGTDPPALEDLTAELLLVAERCFGIHDVAVVDCNAHTTLDELVAAILLPQPQPQPQPPTPSSAVPHTSRPNAPNVAYPAVSGPSRVAAPGDSYFPVGPHHHQRGSSSSRASHNQHQHSGSASAFPPLRALTPLSHTSTSAFAPPAPVPPSPAPLQPQHIATVIVARNLDAAPKPVQIQCLELLRTRRILTRTTVHTAPRPFLFIAAIAAPTPNAIAGRLTQHLNDHFYLAHWHDVESDGFANLDQDRDDGEQGADHGDGEAAVRRKGPEPRRAADTASIDSGESVVRRRSGGTVGTPGLVPANDRGRAETRASSRNTNSSRRQPVAAQPPPPPPNRQQARHQEATVTTLAGEATAHTAQQPHIPPSDVAALTSLASAAAVEVEVLRYRMNLVSFLRLHRAVGAGLGAGGPAAASVSPPAATRHLDFLSRALAVLHGLSYVTPALVALAARKVYLHRVRPVARPGRERSVQWGSDPAAVAALLDGVGAEDVIEDVLGLVAAPV